MTTRISRRGSLTGAAIIAATLPTTAREAAAFWTFIAATGFTTWVLWTERDKDLVEAVGRRRVCILKSMLFAAVAGVPIRKLELNVSVGQEVHF